MKNRNNFKHAFLMVALAAAWPLHGHAAAGVAQFIAGDVSVRRAAGTSDSLAKGRNVESGDDIVTGPNGQAQIRFTDGGLVSLQPNSQFKIDKYVDANDPKQDGFLVSFTRGTMRAITGLIGKRNRENYRVTTATATVGIRGSAFAIGHNTDGSLTVSGYQDAIEVCTNAGCVGLTAGESAQVNGNAQAPVRINVVTTFPSVPSPQPVEFVTGAGGGNFTGTQTDLTFGFSEYYSYGEGGYGNTYLGEGPGTTTFSNGLVTSYNDGYYNYKYDGTSASSFGNVGAVTDPDFIGWGYWAAGSKEYGSYGEGYSSSIRDVHYIVGRETPYESMPGTGMVGTYALIGGTAPTATNSYSGTSSIGTLLGGSMTAYFGVGFQLTISTKFGESQYDINASNMSGYLGTRFYANTSSENGYVQGMFVGPGATRAGVIYHEDVGGSVGVINGAAAFGRTSLAPGAPL